MSVLGSLYDWLDRRVNKSEIRSVTADISDSLAFKEIALYIAVSYIANTLSKCEFKVYEKGVAVKNPLYYVLNVSPNPNQNSSQFVNKIIENYFYDGHALVIKRPYRDELYVADSFGIDGEGFQEHTFDNIVVDSKEINRTFRARDVFYFKLDNREVKRLIDNIYSEYSKILNLALQAYAKTCGSKYKLSVSSLKAGDKEFNDKYKETIEENIKTFLKSSNAVYLQNSGEDLDEIGNTTYASKADSNDIISIRKDIFEVFAQAFKIPVSLFTGNMTNISDILNIYLSFCIDPLADMIGEEITRKQYNMAELKDGCRVKVDTSKIKHIDILESADKIDKFISSGAASIDEARDVLEMDLLNTEFSKAHWITKNYQEIEAALKNLQGEGGES